MGTTGSSTVSSVAEAAAEDESADLCEAEAFANLLEDLGSFLVSFLALDFFSLAGGQSGLGGAT